jgi:hypothetical protein
MRNRILAAVMVVAVCCGCLVSCNEKPRNYKFVKVLQDGKEQVEEFQAPNDTVALNEYIDRMGKMIASSIASGEGSDFKAMFVISPEGDTLNTDEELLKVVSQGLPTMVELPEASTNQQPSDSVAR